MIVFKPFQKAIVCQQTILFETLPSWVTHDRFSTKPDPSPQKLLPWIPRLCASIRVVITFAIDSTRSDRMTCQQFDLIRSLAVKAFGRIAPKESDQIMWFECYPPISEDFSRKRQEKKFAAKVRSLWCVFQWKGAFRNWTGTVMTTDHRRSSLRNVLVDVTFDRPK
jgi:hypothetical protein